MYILIDGNTQSTLNVKMESQNYDMSHDQVIHEIIPLEDNDQQNYGCPVGHSTDNNPTTTTATLQSDSVNCDRYLSSNYLSGEPMQMMQPYFTHDYFPIDNVNHFGQYILTDQQQGLVSTASNMTSSGNGSCVQHNCIAHDAHTPPNSNSLQYNCGQLFGHPSNVATCMCGQVNCHSNARLHRGDAGGFNTPVHHECNFHTPNRCGAMQQCQTGSQIRNIVWNSPSVYDDTLNISGNSYTSK